MEERRFAEFFAGIGLVRLALEPLGWQCVFANDISDDKAEIYREQFGGSELRVTDIREVKANDLPRGLSLVTASFPCIDLSLAGNRNGLDGHHSRAFWPFIRLLNDYCTWGRPPDAILLENVLGLLTSEDGKDLARVIRSVNEIGYRCDIVVVDARWFVPQSRPRVFVIGLHESDEAHFDAWRSTESRLRPPPVQRFVAQHSDLRVGTLPLPDPPLRSSSTLGDVLEDVPSSSDLWWPHAETRRLLRAMNPRHRERVHALMAQPCGSALPLYRRVRNGRTVGEVRSDGIAGCLRTPVGGSSIQFLVVTTNGHVRIRRMTAREYARLQGVPDTFPIQVGQRQAMMGFGDAVCVPAVRWLARYAFRHLEGEPHTVLAASEHQPRLLERKRQYAPAS